MYLILANCLACAFWAALISVNYAHTHLHAHSCWPQREITQATLQVVRNNRRQHRPHFGFLFIYYNFFFCSIFLCFIVHLSGLNWNFESCFPPSPPFFALVSFWCNFWLLVCGTFWDLFLFHFSNCLHMFVHAVFTSLRFWPKIYVYLQFVFI